MIDVEEPKFIVGDALNLDFIEDSSVDLIVTSPPYLFQDCNRYGGNPEGQLNFNINEIEMIDRLFLAFKEMSRVLKNDGVIAINIGESFQEDLSSYMLPEKFIFKVIDETDFRVHKEIIVKEEITLLYDESKNYLKWYLLFRGNPFTNEYYRNRYRGNLWLLDTEPPYPDILRLTGGVLDSFPGSLPERFIRIYSRPGDIVLDPFGGLGTTAIAAYENNRYGVSVDISVDQKLIAKENFELYKRELVKK